MFPHKTIRGVCLLGFGLAALAADLRISGPYSHDNLSIYLIHGSAKPPLTPKSLKLAVGEEKDQSKVWNYVGVMQDKLRPASAAPPPTTSMQLTLESQDVAKATGAYVEKLAKIVDGKPDVIGYAY